MEKYLGIKYTPRFIVSSLGRIDKTKAYDVLIHAFSIVNKTIPDAVLVIAGNDNGEKNKLIMLIERLGLTKKAFIIDGIYGTEKIDYLANSDVFVLPSHSENFGNVYIESLAAGTPIIASTNTPWSDVEKNNCGKWINNTDKETATAIIEMFHSNLVDMGKSAKNYVRQYDWSELADRFISIYRAELK